uniref:Protein kinase domain-containing protein n=1 Tax=Daucus carota subsp. sativus TaxID=79200 RepID=A0A175YMJ7_DAUCS
MRVGSRVNIPFSCECINGDFLGHTFAYVAQPDDTYGKIAAVAFANLTTAYWMERVNVFDPTRIPDMGLINVTLNCSCGDRHVSKEYGLFVTYPLRPGEDLSSVARESGVPDKLLERFNPDTDFSDGAAIVFLPAKDVWGNYPPLKDRKKDVAEGSFVRAGFVDGGIEHMHGAGIDLQKMSDFGQHTSGSSFNSITVNRSVEFSYEELAHATNDFSLANKIGQGGYGLVYYGELRGEKAAIKKMDIQASKEFLAELKVLSHVHHYNLMLRLTSLNQMQVCLIGYSIEDSLFLVYQYIENGNLSQHLHGSSGRRPLSWSSRVQIALDSARGLEYIHEHTVPVYIHRDIKPANILIDNNFRAKVADFGLTRLTEVTGSLQTRLVGTFGYMPPEYARYGDVSPKIDVYAFGVVLYELISAKDAIVKINEVESRALVALFAEVLNQPNPSSDLTTLVDPRLGADYSIDSVRKIAQIAKACTQENPQLRPSMRSIVVALMTLSSANEDWDVGTFYEDQGLVNLMSGR